MNRTTAIAEELTPDVETIPDSVYGQQLVAAWDSSSSDVEQVALGGALFHLQQWLMELRRQNLAHQDDEGVFVLSTMVASRFALGFRPCSAFVVMPELEMRWAQAIAWSHAAMRAGKRDLFLVASPIEIDGALSPRFGLSFSIDSQARADTLMNYGALELRRFEKIPAASPSGEVRWKVSDQDLARMPLVIVEEDEAVFGVAQARKKRAFGAGR